MPVLNTKEEIASYFSDALGPEAVWCPPSGRPYIKVAHKGTADLLMAINMEMIVQDAVVVPGDPAIPVHVVAVALRFFQRHGISTSFSPPLAAREMADGAGMTRLSKHVFPLCIATPGMHPAKAWEDQDVTAKLVSWVQGVCEIANATPVSTGILEAIVDLPLSRAKAGNNLPLGGYLFSTDICFVE